MESARGTGRRCRTRSPRLPRRLLARTTAVVAAAVVSRLPVHAAQTETLMAVVGRDFVMVGADSSVSQSIALTASNLDKIAVLVEPLAFVDDRPRDPRYQQTVVAAVAGDAADADRLVGLLQAYCTIKEYETGVGSDVVFRSLAGKDSRRRRKQPSSAAAADPSHDRYSAMHGHGLTVEAVAQFARGQIVSALRSRTPSRVSLLVAGLMPVYGIAPEAVRTVDGGHTVPARHALPIALQVQRQVDAATRSGNGNGREQPPSTTERTARDSEDSVDADRLDTTGPVPQRGQPSLYLEPRLYWLDEYGAMQRVQYGAHGYGSNFVLSVLDRGYRRDMTRDECIRLLNECFRQLRTRYVINSPQPPCIKCVDARGCVLVVQ